MPDPPVGSMWRVTGRPKSNTTWIDDRLTIWSNPIASWQLRDDEKRALEARLEPGVRIVVLGQERSPRDRNHEFVKVMSPAMAVGYINRVHFNTGSITLERLA